MRKFFLFLFLFLAVPLFTLVGHPTAASAQATQAVTDADPLVAIAKLREELLDSFNKGDLPRLLSHLDPDVVVTWQNGEVCRGPEAVKAYYNKMMSGPDRIVAKLHADPKVTDRHIYGDWAVSWGDMNDEFLLEDGSHFNFHSKFTSTIAKRGDVWKVTSFHASVNAFDNDILHYAMKKTFAWSLLGGLVPGLIVGVIIAKTIRRKKA